MKKVILFCYVSVFVFLSIFNGAISVSTAKENQNIPEMNFSYGGRNRTATELKNSIYDQLILSYLAGEDVNALHLKDGNVKIPVKNGDYILIPMKNNLDIMVQATKESKNDNMAEKKQTRSSEVTYVGELFKPGYPISNTVCAPKTGPLTHTFQLSSSFMYQISSSHGITIEDFEQSLGFNLNRSFTLSEEYTYTIPRNRCGTIYGCEIYDKYTYEKPSWFGGNQTATLLVPKRYLIYVIVR